MGKLYLFYSQETRQSETADCVPGAQFAAIVSQADLGMFSLLGRTDAPSKGQKFFFFTFVQHGNKPEILK